MCSHGLQRGPRFCEVLCHRDPAEVLRRKELWPCPLMCVCMFSGLMHRHIYVGKWCITGFDKCWAYTMKFLLTVLLFFSYIKLGRSNAIHSGIIIFSLCPNIYRNITSIWHINSAFTDFNNHVINKKWYFYSPRSIFKGSWTANLHQSNKARTFYFSEFIISLWKKSLWRDYN